MEITEHPPDRPLGDPFFDAFRRRHPHVDVVLIAERPPRGDPRDPGERGED